MEGFLVALIVYWTFRCAVVVYQKGTGKPFVLTPSWLTVVLNMVGIGFAVKALVSWI